MPLSNTLKAFFLLSRARARKRISLFVFVSAVKDDKDGKKYQSRLLFFPLIFSSRHRFFELKWIRFADIFFSSSVVEDIAMQFLVQRWPVNFLKELKITNLKGIKTRRCFNCKTYQVQRIPQSSKLFFSIWTS